MNNNQVLPFERNRYYSGKMLSSADFQIEQTYNNNKRRFINQMMFGQGIVCGLSVYNLDDLSLMVDSGVAIDAHGREIVIESTVIQKLSAIQGFDELETNQASLCIKYGEEPVHGVYAPTQEGRECEFNHIDEAYELYLVDKEKTEQEFEMESEFLLRGELIHHKDYTLELSVPAVVCMGKFAKILLNLTKNTEEPCEFSYRGILQMPMFTTMEGKHEIEIVLEDHSLEPEESLVREIWVRVQNISTEEAKIIVKPDSAAGMVNGEGIETDGNFLLTVVIADINPRELVDRELGKTSLEMRGMAGQKDYVKLADISFERTDAGCVISEIEEKKVKQYIETPSDGAVRNEYLGYYAMYSPKEKIVQTGVTSGKQTESADLPQRFSSGYFEIPLGKGAKKGEIFYSGEILHSLGRGDIYIETGYEGTETEPSLGKEIHTVIYGNTGIFKEDENVPVIESAIKIRRDKGTFVAGIRFLKDYHAVVLRCKWVAVKIKGDSGEAPGSGMGYITTEKPTIILKPQETCFFPIKFVNMESCHLCYELADSGSGTISEDGVYQAPDQAGVYEIHIFCANDPLICTYAYAVVKETGE